MKVDSFEELASLARREPVVADIPQFSDFYLDDINIYHSIESFHQNLYDPTYQFDKDVVVAESDPVPGYSFVECTADPITPDLNTVVDWTSPEHYDRFSRQLLSQSDIQDYILETVSTEDLVILVIVDGLSYNTLTDTDYQMQPVYVDGISTTGPGFKRVVFGGKTRSVCSALMMEHDFYSARGFTYWEKGQEELSTQLHDGIPNKYVERIRDFDKAVSGMKRESPLNENLYVQITRMGFDQEAHQRKEEPNWKAIKEELLSDIQKLTDQAARLTDNFRIFVTADHGVLWREDLPDDPPVVFEDYYHHARYVDDGVQTEYGISRSDPDGNMATGLGYPYVTRDLDHTEWGVHGGFSYYESLIPLIEVSHDTIGGQE